MVGILHKLTKLKSAAPQSFVVVVFKIFIYLFIYLCLSWVFISARGLSLVAASGGHSSSQWAGLSLSRPLLLRSTGSRRTGSVVVAHGPSCSTACGIFPDQGSNPCPVRWQADSQPLCHQGSPLQSFEDNIFKTQDKTEAFYFKILYWQKFIQINNIFIFPTLSEHIRLNKLPLREKVNRYSY